MDGLDFRILASLHQNGLLSQAAIGREVGLTAPAVASRIQRIEQSETLLGFRADIHAAVFGQTSTLHILPGPFEESQIAQALARENVVWVAWKSDGGMTVMSFGPTDLSPIGDVVGTIEGDGRTTAPPGRLARRVLAAVVDEPRASRDRLAKLTHLSPKTCAKHRAAAIQTSDLAIVPVLGALGGEGAIIYHAAVFGSAPQASIGAALQQAVLVNRTPSVQYWLCMAPDYASALARQGAARDAGAEVRITMNRKLVQNDARLKSWLTQDAS